MYSFRISHNFYMLVLVPTMFLFLRDSWRNKLHKMTWANRFQDSEYSVYLLITAYAVTSATTINGDCVTVSATPVVLPTPFTVVTAANPCVTETQELQSIVESDFVTWLHPTSTCSLAPTCFDAECLFSSALGTLLAQNPGAVSLPPSFQGLLLTPALTESHNQSYSGL